jgi:cytoskeletal protein CcmA (bactofilin family)/ribosomal protein S27AE
VAGESEKNAGKVPVHCPHCGFSQYESAHSKSAFCRKCSKQFDVRAASAEPEQASVEKPSFLEKIGRLIGGEKIRTAYCSECGTAQELSTEMESSLCGKCGAYLDLRDFKITEPFTRNIRTSGAIIITKKGELTSTRVMCGEAIIQGKISGNLICSGPTRIKFKGRLFGSIDTREFVIEKGCDAELVRPVKCDHAEIHGKVSARITAAHIVTVSSTGVLEGTVYAKSIVVEKGGSFHGELFIGKTELSQTELLSGDALGISQSSLAFGQ